MDITLVLAKVLGGILLAVGVSALNKRWISTVIADIERSSGLFWMYGFVAFVIGVTTISLYDAWTSDWRVLITIIGWLCILKGVGLMVFPQSMLAVYKKVKLASIVPFSGVISVLLGLALLYFGFAF